MHITCQCSCQSVRLKSSDVEKRQSCSYFGHRVTVNGKTQTQNSACIQGAQDINLFYLKQKEKVDESATACTKGKSQGTQGKPHSHASLVTAGTAELKVTVQVWVGVAGQRS